MRKQTTTYACDGCGRTVAGRKELHSFRFEDLDGRGYVLAAVKFELCSQCETEIVGSVAQYVQDDDRGRLLDMPRLVTT